MSVFSPGVAGDVTALIAAHPLAWIISNGPTGFVSTPLPLLAECDGEGRVIALFGHFAKRNPHVAALEADPRAAILFQGAEGYVSPRLVSNPTWGPTWNYAVVRFETEVTFVPEETPSAVERLAAHLEGTGPGAWTVAEMGARAAPMLDHIVAFRARVLSERATFKLGQDESAQTFEEIVTRHPNGALVDAMRGAARKG
jgi:transcriptional regulator